MEGTVSAKGQEHFRVLSLRQKPEWALRWHLKRVLLPRRSITGRLVSGQVWRRHDGRKWIYKKCLEWQNAD
jgi:hypothetical protein